MTEELLTPKQWCIQQNLAKPGKGRLSLDAHKAIAEAMAQGVRFADPKAIVAQARAAATGKPVTTVDQSFGCRGCTNRWTGLKRAHCAACHSTFSTPANFDKHKPGTCLDPSSIGLVQNSKGIWTMPGVVD